MTMDWVYVATVILPILAFILGRLNSAKIQARETAIQQERLKVAMDRQDKLKTSIDCIHEAMHDMDKRVSVIEKLVSHYEKTR